MIMVARGPKESLQEGDGLVDKLFGPRVDKEVQCCRTLAPANIWCCSSMWIGIFSPDELAYQKEVTYKHPDTGEARTITPEDTLSCWTPWSL